MREDKRKRDEDRKVRQQRLTGGGASMFGADGAPQIDNAFIDKILRDEDPYEHKEEKKEEEKESVKLKTSSYVIDMEIHPPVSYF
jgi:hypothetical protein